MPVVVIERRILNLSFEEPTRHFKFSEDGITNEVANQKLALSILVW